MKDLTVATKRMREAFEAWIRPKRGGVLSGWCSPEGTYTDARDQQLWEAFKVGWKRCHRRALTVEGRTPQAERGDGIVGRTADEPHRPLVCYVCAGRFPITYNFCSEHKDEYEQLKREASASPENSAPLPNRNTLWFANGKVECQHADPPIRRWTKV